MNLILGQLRVFRCLDIRKILLLTLQSVLHWLFCYLGTGFHEMVRTTALFLGQVITLTTEKELSNLF